MIAGLDFSGVGEVPVGCHVDWRSEALVAPRSVLLVSVVALSLHIGLVVQHSPLKPVEEVLSQVKDPAGGLEAGYLPEAGIGDAESDPWGLCLLVETVLVT